MYENINTDCDKSISIPEKYLSENCATWSELNEIKKLWDKGIKNLENLNLDGLENLNLDGLENVDI